MCSLILVKLFDEVKEAGDWGDGTAKGAGAEVKPTGSKGSIEEENELAGTRGEGYVPEVPASRETDGSGCDDGVGGTETIPYMHLPFPPIKS